MSNPSSDKETPQYDGCSPPNQSHQGPQNIHGLPVQIGPDFIPVPSDPPHSAPEAAALHSRILEVKNRWGVSYRDAAYILFLVTADIANERTKLGEALMKHSQNIGTTLSLFSSDDLPESSPNVRSSASPRTPSKRDSARQ